MKRLLTLLAALVVVGAAVTVAVNNNGTDVHVHLPKLGHVPAKPKALEHQVKAAQEAATSRCPLPAPVARERAEQDGHGRQPVQNIGPNVDHDMGDCAPGPPVKADITVRSTLGIDRSNNNPDFGSSTWAGVHRAGVTYVWLKTSEGVSFRDRTLVPMANYARVAGLLVGGYHFAHVCMTSADAEAQVFISQLRAARLDTPDSARPIIDAEYGGCSSGAGTRIWIARMEYVLRTTLHRRIGVYSGNWWIGPRTDCLFAHLPKETLAWISGYPFASTPCGHALDVHQFSDSYPTGPIRGDVNRLREASFDDLFARGVPVASKEATHQCRMHNHYAAWYRKYKARFKEKGHLGEFGAKRLGSADEHLRRIRHYFVKNHDKGKTNYDCLSDGNVRVRVL